MQTIIQVGMADLNVALFPNRIRTSGLGSCVGVAIYDSLSNLAGIAHVMLPSSDLAKNTDFNKAKYADTAIPALIDLMQDCGGNRRFFKAKITGGAQMFARHSSTLTKSVGTRNIEACKEQLKKCNVSIVAEDTGGNYGRTIEMDTTSGMLQIRTVNQGIKEV